jgi:hypothetical protein
MVAGTSDSVVRTTRTGGRFSSASPEGSEGPGDHDPVASSPNNRSRISRLFFSSFNTVSAFQFVFFAIL